MQLARKECYQTTRIHGAGARWRPRASFKCIVDKNGTQYSLIPLMESKETFDYTIPSFAVIIYRGRSESLLAGSSRSRRWYIHQYSAAVTDGFIRDTEEVNARISPTRIAIEQSSSHVYLVQVLKRESVFMSALCTLHRE